MLLFATRYRQSTHRSSVTSLNPSPLGLSLFNFTGVERMQLPSLNWCYHFCDVTVLPIQWVHSPHSTPLLLSYLSFLHPSSSPPLSHITPPLHCTSTSPPFPFSFSLSLSLSLSLYPLTHPSSSSSPPPLLPPCAEPAEEDLQFLQDLLDYFYTQREHRAEVITPTQVPPSPAEGLSHPKPDVGSYSRTPPLTTTPVSSQLDVSMYVGWVWSSAVTRFLPDLTDKTLCVMANVTLCLHNYVTQVTGQWR